MVCNDVLYTLVDLFDMAGSYYQNGDPVIHCNNANTNVTPLRQHPIYA